MPRSSPSAAPAAKLGTFDLSGCDMYVNGTPVLHVHGQHPLGEDLQVYYALSPEASAEIGLGDEHLYAEMARRWASGRSCR